MASKREQVAEKIAATAVQSAIFLDPSGRRWRRLRYLLIAALAIVIGIGWYIIPKMYAAPVLVSHADYPDITSAQTQIRS